jgi:DNA-binding transcriptional MerR regulator
MPDTPQLEIPNRALFKATEVCELAKVQPYVLRSWEAEFPDLGVAKNAGAPRVYRRADVQQVLRIKHLLLVEGLTLAGARRRISEETMPPAGESPAIDELIGQNARARLTAVKRGLRSILDLLAGASGGEEFALAPPVVSPPRARAVPADRAKAARGKDPRARRNSGRAPQARRNRSA